MAEELEYKSAFEGEQIDRAVSAIINGEIKADADRAEAAAEAAQKAREGVEGFAEQAGKSAGEATGSATAAQKSAEDAEAAKNDVAANATKAETAANAAKDSETASKSSETAAGKSATDADQHRKDAETAQAAAESAKSATEGLATAAGNSATQADQRATDAESAAGAAGSSATAAEQARRAIEALGVLGVTLPAGSDVAVEKIVDESGVVTLKFSIPQGVKGDTGDTGAQGVSITKIERTSGTGAAGTTDTYTITLSNGTTSTFQVYNGKDGDGAGDMLASVYDPEGKAENVYEYADKSVAKHVLTANRNVYVSNDGNDETGDGTMANPWATIQKAVDEGPEETGAYIYGIYLTGGTYAGFVLNGKRVQLNKRNGDVVITSLITITNGAHINMTFPFTASPPSPQTGFTVSRFAVANVGPINFNGCANGINIFEGGRLATGPGAELNVNNCTIAGINVRSGGYAKVGNITGAGNNQNISVDGGIVSYTSYTASPGTEPDQAINGGIITNDLATNKVVEDAVQELKDNPTLTGGIPSATTYTKAGDTEGIYFTVDMPNGSTTPIENELIFVAFHVTNKSTNAIIRINGGIPKVLSRNRKSATGSVGATLTPGMLLPQKKYLLRYFNNGWRIVGEFEKPESGDLYGPVLPANAGLGRDISAEPVGLYPVTNGAEPVLLRTSEEVAADIAPFMPSKRDADIRRYPVKVGETVQAGDVVDVVGGAVGAGFSPILPEKVPFYSGTVQSAKLIRLSENSAAIAHKEQSGAGATSVMAVFNNGGKITYSNVITPQSSAAYISHSLVKLSDTRFIFFYCLSTRVYYSVLSLIGEVLSTAYTGSFATPQGGVARHVLALPITSSSVLLVHDSDSRIRARVMTDTGTELQSGTEVQLAIATGSSGEILGAKKSSNTALITFEGSSSPYNSPLSFVANISGKTVTLGNTYNIPSGLSIKPADVCSDDTVILYGTKSLAPVKISGMAVDFGAPSPIQCDNIVTISEAGGTISMVIQDNSKSKAALLYKEGDAFTAGEYSELAQTYTYFAVGTVQLSSRFAVAGSIGSGSSGFSSLIADHRRIAGGFETTSSQAIALTSGTGGQSIDVIFDGTAELAGITAGTSITSPGVRGYCPQDGWLSVKPEWEQNFGPFYISGSYTGNGTQSRPINIGARPAFVIVQGGIVDSNNIGISFILDSGATDGFFVDQYIRASPASGCRITDEGFITGAGGALGNISGVPYKYIAVVLRKGGAA